MKKVIITITCQMNDGSELRTAITEVDSKLIKNMIPGWVRIYTGFGPNDREALPTGVLMAEATFELPKA